MRGPPMPRPSLARSRTSDPLPDQSSAPLALTDAQLDAIHRAAWPLAPADRGPFLEAVAQALQQERTIGDGVVYRVAMQVQRRYWTPPIEHVGKYR
jgi:hypothetical protein